MKSFERRFEGGEVLQGLLELAQSPLSADEVLARFVEAHALNVPHREVIPTLFDGEPKFPDPQLAQRLFQNLLGLWDLVGAGRKVDLWAEKPQRPKKKEAVRPGLFGEGGPDPTFVELAWRYLEDAPKEAQKLSHAFENRQDELLGWLDEQGLSDDGYGAVRLLLFELFAMLELGWAPGVRSVRREELTGSPAQAALPFALTAYADEALFETEQDEQAKVSSEEMVRLRALVERALGALWRARKPA
jgi:hypothetical protein